MPKFYRAADQQYDAEAVAALRNDLIKIRDAHLEKSDFGPTVVLSHSIALLAAVIEDMQNG
jgi:hypothetical protein